MRFPDELALEVAARMSGSVDPSKTSEAERNERPPLHRGPLHTPALDAATSSGSEEVVPELIYGGRRFCYSSVTFKSAHRN